MSWFQADWLARDGARGESEAGGVGEDLAGAEVRVGADGLGGGGGEGDREAISERRDREQQNAPCRV